MGAKIFFCQSCKKSPLILCVCLLPAKSYYLSKNGLWKIKIENWLLDLEKSASIWKVSGERKVKNVVWKVRSRPLPLIKGPLLSTNDYNHLFLSKLQSFDQNWLKKMVVPPIQTWNQVFHAIAYAFQSLALFRNHFFFLVIISDLHSAWKSKKCLIFSRFQNLMVFLSGVNFSLMDMFLCVVSSKVSSSFSCTVGLGLE